GPLHRPGSYARTGGSAGASAKRCRAATGRIGLASVDRRMRALFLFCLFLPLHHRAQDARAFRHALLSGNLNQMDRWMKHEVHRQRKGRLIQAPGGRYVSHAGTLDSLTAFLTRQPGVLEAAWDRCAEKAAIWPGRSTIG